MLEIATLQFLAALTLNHSLAWIVKNRWLCISFLGGFGPITYYGIGRGQGLVEFEATSLPFIIAGWTLYGLMTHQLYLCVQPGSKTCAPVYCLLQLFSA